MFGSMLIILNIKINAQTISMHSGMLLTGKKVNELYNATK